MDGDTKAACSLQTPEYSEMIVRDSIRQKVLKPGATCEDAIQMAHEMIKAFGGDFTPTSVTVKSRTADTVLVRVTYPDSTPESYRLRAVDGNWLVAAEE